MIKGKEYITNKEFEGILFRSITIIMSILLSL